MPASNLRQAVPQAPSGAHLNSSAPPCIPGVSYSESQASLKEIIETGNLDGWEAQSESLLCHGWAQCRCYYFIWTVLCWEE